MQIKEIDRYKSSKDISLIFNNKEIKMINETRIDFFDKTDKVCSRSELIKIALLFLKKNIQKTNQAELSSLFDLMKKKEKA